MKKIFKNLIIASFGIFTCASCNSKISVCEINGYKSNQITLNSLYESKTDSDFFCTLVYSEKATVSNFFIEEDLGSNKKGLFEVILYMDNIPILDNDNIVKMSDLKEGDIVICYTQSVLETSPAQIYCEKLFYIGQ